MDILAKSISSKGLFEQMCSMEHEQVVYYYDKETRLKAIVGIHDTTLGPALGGVRVWEYDNEAMALSDVLRLSRGMTYKSAAADLQLGGGKAVIILNKNVKKNKAMMIKYGQFIHSLSGKYITAEDVGITTDDIETIADQTPYVAGLSERAGGLGTPSPLTALGTYIGIKAAAKIAYGNDSLANKKVALQGTGHVGIELIKFLQKENCKIYASDFYADRLAQVCKNFAINPVELDEIYDLPVDIYAPCALGGTINDHTLSRLKCKIIAGCANNQLENEDKHGDKCMEKDILYVPDFIINCGGIVKIYAEYKRYDIQWATNHIEKLYGKIVNILKESSKRQLNTQIIANQMALSNLKKNKINS